MIISLIADTVFSNPPLAGYPFRLLNLIKAYAAYGINVQLFLCNRNFTTTKQLLWLKQIANNTKIFIINAEVFYRKNFLEKLLTCYQAKIIQFENPELVINNFNFIKKNFHSHIFVLELQDLYYRSTHNYHYRHLVKQALDLVDYVICLSRKDRNIIKKDFSKVNAKVLYSPLFVDPAQYKFYGPNLKENNLLFIGNLYHKPNLKAAEFLIKKILPKIVKEIQDIHINFLGLIPDNLPKAFKTKSSHYTFHGFVKKYDFVLKRTTLGLAPIFDGYGSRVKLFEYSAFGIPVLATPKAIQGAENLKGVFVANRGQFASRLHKLLINKKCLIEAARVNRHSIEKYYSSTKVIDDLLTRITKKQKSLLPKIRIPREIYLPFWLKEKRHKDNTLKNNYLITPNDIKII